MDEIRARLSKRIAEKHKPGEISARALSLRLGKKDGYISDFLRGDSDTLHYEDRVKLAKWLDMPMRDLGIGEIATVADTPAPPAGLREDATPFTPPDSHYLARSQHIAYFTMRTRALDQHPERIRPGTLLAFDLNKVRPSEIPSGTIVIVQLYDKRDLATSHGTIIRQFIAPNKLVTNSSEANEIISLDDASLPFEPVIKGALISAVREFQ